VRGILLLGLLLGSAAYADNTTLHFTAAGSVAATDNVFGTSTNTESDLFFQIRPGVLLTHDGPRLIQIYSAEAEILEYVDHSDKPSLTYRAAWKGNFLISPLVDVVGTVAASTGTLNALTARGTADQPVVNIVPAGDSTVNQIDAGEVLTRQLGKTYRFRQGLAAHYADTNDDSDDTTSSFDSDLSLGLERDSEANSLVLLFDVDFIRLRRVSPAPMVPPNPPIANPQGNRQDQQLNPRATLSWRHDYNRYWSSSATIGVATLNPVGHDPFNLMDTHRPASLYTIGQAALNYTELWGRASLLVARNVSPDLLLAESTLTTSATAALSLPLPWLDDHRRQSPKLVAAGSTGILRSELLPTENLPGFDQGTFDAYHVDLGVTYSPYPNQTYGVRYEYVYQTGDAAALLLLPAYSRSTLFFTFAFRYPERLAVDIKDLHDGSQPTRADRTDVVPMTDSEAPKDDDNSNGVTGAKPVDD
jgi:hypothetical protein